MRGAAHALHRLLLAHPTVPRSRITVVTHSSGNHAQALALASRDLGVQCHVVMPRTAPAVKKAAVRGYGAIVTECEPTLEARQHATGQIIEQLQKDAEVSGEERVAKLIPPYDHEDIIAGQGTAVLELFSQVGQHDPNTTLDVVITPVGGGGLLSGTSIATKSLSPSTLVFGAEPTGAADAHRSYTTGQFHPSIEPRTIADGLLTSLGTLNFPIILEHADGIYTVTDEQIVRAMKLIWERMKIVVEPSGAVGLAVVLFSVEFQERVKMLRKEGVVNVGIVLSGGNIDLERMGDIFKGPQAQ
jgi:threonine dehydratase